MVPVKAAAVAFAYRDIFGHWDTPSIKPVHLQALMRSHHLSTRDQTFALLLFGSGKNGVTSLLSGRTTTFGIE
jgi:hypothetical protein